MKLSYTGARNHFGNLVNASDTTTLALADTLMNLRRRVILSARPWWFLEKAFTLTTLASTQFYALPGQVDRLLSDPYITVSSTRYKPKECVSRAEWDRINETSYTSDVPEWWILYANQVGFWPTPASASNTITLNAKQKVVDLSVADYTTGTIVSVAAAGTAIVGSSTSWTAGMIGKYIKITAGNAANLGDDIWYLISAVTDTTHLTIANAYGGAAIATGSANYTIGQLSILPEAYDELPLFMALQVYYTSPDGNPEKATMYASMAKDLYSQMLSDHSNRTGGRVLDEGLGEDDPMNPNLFITL